MPSPPCPSLIDVDLPGKRYPRQPRRGLRARTAEGSADVIEGCDVPAASYLLWLTLNAPKAILLVVEPRTFLTEYACVFACRSPSSPANHTLCERVACSRVRSVQKAKGPYLWLTRVRASIEMQTMP